jgi:glutamyl-tRNA reductase
VDVVVVGLNHRSAPIALLERLAIPEERLGKALHQLLNYEHVLEGVILSTCNRLEIVAVVSRYHGGAQDLRNLMAEFCHVAPEELTDHLYTYHDDGAVRHLFRVATGIDSMVVGESEILGQVRRAYTVAHEEGAAGRVLGHAFRQALHVGKRARTETEIGRNPVSVSSAAVELARRALVSRSLAGARVLVVGAGEMGRLAVRALTQAGVSEVVVMSRTHSKARAVADATGAEARALEQLEDAVCGADIVISSTTSSAMILGRELVERAAARRADGDPLLIVDIAVPRDVDPECAGLRGVVLRDLYDLRGVVEASMGGRIGEISKVEEIVAAEVARFVQWERAGEIAPAISSLVARAEAMRRAELARMSARLEDLSALERQAVDQLTKRIVAKLLHRPLDVAKELASSKQGYLALQALRDLFELEDEPGP